ncbi:MAG: hypothetical protein AAGA48_24675 [Myxococcota bacterium]
MSRWIVLAVSLVACASTESPDPGGPDASPTPDPTVPANPFDPPPQATGAIVQLIDRGLPLEGEPVVVHHVDGTERTRLYTDRLGRVLIVDLPAEGVGVTFNRAVLDETEGLVTIYGIHAGDKRTFGTADSPVLEVDFTLPSEAITGAQEFWIRAGCTSKSTFQAGARGTIDVDPRCLDNDQLDVTVIARDATATPIAWAQQIDVSQAMADFSDVTWQFDVEAIEIEALGTEDGSTPSVTTWAPGRRGAETVALDVIALQAGEVGLTTAYTLPGTSTADVRIMDDHVWFDLGERWFHEVLRHEAVDPTSPLTAPTTPPGWIGNLHSIDGVITVEDREPFQCGEFETPTASRLFLQTEGFHWQIVYPGALPDELVVPELTEDPPEWTGARIVATESATYGRTYDDVLNNLSPIYALDQPRLTMGGAHCRRGAATF